MISHPTPKHRIPVDRAAKMTARYRKQKKAILKPDFAGKKDILPICETFDKEAVLRLLSHPRCTGMRVYYSMDEDLKVHALLVGVDAEGRDILPKSGTKQLATASLEGDEEEGEVLDEARRCPPDCPPDSDLNPDDPDEDDPDQDDPNP